MEWVKCTDRLPKKHEEVLAYRFQDAQHEIIISYLSWTLENEPIWADEVSNYSHWMPIPEPPNDEMDALNKRLQQDYDDMVKSMWRPTPPRNENV